MRRSNRKLQRREHMDEVRTLGHRVFALNPILKSLRLVISDTGELTTIHFFDSRRQIIPDFALVLAERLSDELRFYDGFLIEEFGKKTRVTMYIHNGSLITEITGD